MSPNLRSLFSLRTKCVRSLSNTLFSTIETRPQKGTKHFLTCFKTIARYLSKINLTNLDADA